MPIRVVASINNVTGDHCVDVFVREDGSFGFEEYRRDHEDQRGWFPLNRYSLQRFESQEEALRQARLSIAWMAQSPRTSIAQPVPELPVADVERAQAHYRDVLGFDIGWLAAGKEIGSVSRGNVAIFFRKRTPPFEPAVNWIFAHDIDATHEELKSSGAKIVEPLVAKPWGLRQFTVEDLDGNRFHFHHD